MVALKKKGRRRTGGADGDQLKAIRLKNPGVASGHMAASTFMLPRMLRDVARAGLRNHYTFDLENCHPTLIAARHDSAFLKNFVAERNAILAKTHPDRTAAKELYLRLLYGGSIENWVKAHEMTTFPMMDYALEFQRTVRALVAEDCSKNRDVLKRLRDETARPRELLCYVLNTAQERELIDRVVSVVHRLDGDVLACEKRRSLLGVRGRFGPAPQRDQVRAGRVRFHAEATALGSERARGGRGGDLQERRPAHSGALECQGHPLAGAPRLRHEGIHIPADASRDFRPGRDADTRGPRQHAVPSARDLQDPLGHWAQVLVRPGQEDLGHDRGFRHRRAQVDRPGRVPARSVRLQDGLAYGGERRGDRIAMEILQPVLREGCGRRVQDSSLCAQLRLGVG